MSEVKTVRKKKKKLSTSALVLIIACIIIAIPFIVFLVIILSASFKTGTPIFGERFTNDLNPAISSSHIEAIEKDVKSISGVDDCEVVLISAQFRVNIDTKDSATDDEIKDITISAYEAVNKELPVNTYFKMSSGGERMYDLAINAYNYVPSNSEDAGWISYVLTKNSKMDDYSVQSLSSPINPELAKELRGEIVPEEQDTDLEGEGEEPAE